MPPRRSARTRPRVPTHQPRVACPRRAQVNPTPVTRRARVNPTPVTETPSITTPVTPPEPGLPQTTNELEQLISERISAALANARDVNSGRPIVEVNGLRNGLGSTLNSHHEEPQRPCSYKDFMSCKPKNFFGNEGIIGLTRWIEKIEGVFEICFCLESSKVRFAACTLLDGALKWWNDHVKTLGVTTANSMTWGEFKALLIEEYCPRDEVQVLEHELWNLKMKDADIKAYTNRFNDLALLCPGMVTSENKKIERYVGGLAPKINGMVLSSKPTTYLSVKRLAFQLTKNEIKQGTMTAKVETPKTGNNLYKRKFNRGNQNQPKKQQIEKAYAVTSTPAQTVTTKIFV
ncbi:hypothetical protein L1887_07004 [Cichorium endivia]|nr:hypothetical protein L1887_07004 [Cichorium endivia]